MASFFDVVFADLRTSRKQVNRLVGTGLVFALVGHFYVVEPYFEYKRLDRVTAQRIADGERLVADLAGRLNQLKTASGRSHAALEAIQADIRAFPDHLAGTIPRIERALRGGPSFEDPSSSPIQAQTNAPAVAGGLRLPPDISTVDAGVRWYVRDWFGRLLSRLEDEVIAPLASGQERSRVGGVEADAAVGSPELSRIAATASEEIRQYTEHAPPDFWRSYWGGKVPVAQGLEQVVERSFGAVVQVVSRRVADTERLIQAQDQDVTSQRAALAVSQTSQKELMVRLSSLESPFGKIPVGLTDLIKLFPLLVAGTVVMVMGVIGKSRQLFVALEREAGRAGQGATPEGLAALVDCWYLPPYTGRLPCTALIGAFGVALAVAARAAWLVATEPDLFATLGDGGTAWVRIGFAGAYAAGLVVTTVLAWRMGRELARRPAAEV